jgi:plasmid stability protein
MHIAHTEWKMATLQVRELPDDVYQRLRALAAAENRSVAQETVVLLREALQNGVDAKERRKALLKQLQNVDLPQKSSLETPEAIIREDRQR